MNVAHSRVLIIGVGNVYRSDDGIGISVVQQLRQRVLTRVAVLEQSGEGTALLESWKGFDAVIVVDAVRSAAEPGTIYRLDANASQVPRGFLHYSTHTFGVAEAIELARALELLPEHLIVYGVEGETFARGSGLSSAVEQAVGSVIEQVLEESRALLASECRSEACKWSRIVDLAVIFSAALHVSANFDAASYMRMLRAVGLERAE